MEGRAEAAARGDAVSQAGEAVQARPRRGEGQFEEGAGLLPQRGGAWVHARDGRRRVDLLGDGEEGGGDRLVPARGGARRSHRTVQFGHLLLTRYQIIKKNSNF